jgi:hypothetical protein
MSATAGSDTGAMATDLVEEIGAEFDRRLDARLAALAPAGGTAAGAPPDTPSAAVPAPERRPRRPADVSRSLRQSLWLGIVIGSAVTGTAAVAMSVGISDQADTNLGGSEPYVFVNAAGVVLAGLAGAWVILLVIYITLVSQARYHAGPR